MAGRETFELFHREPATSLGTAGRVMMAVWRQPFTLGKLAQVRRMYDEAWNRYRVPLAMFTVIETGAFDVRGLSDEAVRGAVGALLEHYRGKMVAAASVIDGSGFVSAAIRSAGSALMLVARQPFPHRIFADSPTAVSWLVKQLASGEGETAARARSVLISEAEIHAGLAVLRAPPAEVSMPAPFTVPPRARG